MKTKGLVFIGLASFITERFGQEALLHLLDGLVDEPRFFIGSLDPYRWYPSELSIQILEVAIKELGNGDTNPAREMGAEISRLHHRLSPGDFIRTPETSLAGTLNWFWLFYHNEGQVRLIEDGDDFILKVFCPVKLTRSYMECIAGWTENLMIVWGEKYAVVSTDEPMELRIVKMGPAHL